MRGAKPHGNYTAHSCPCSSGCQSLWPCRASQLCFSRDPEPTGQLTSEALAPFTRRVHGDADATVRSAGATSGGVTFLLFMAFNSSLVRNVFHAHPERAREREMKRILWFAHTARNVETKLPIHVVCAGERDAASEVKLEKAGLRLIEGPMVPTPPWASKWHRLSFNKIAALSFTQFRKVVLLDNDAGFLKNMDHLALSAPTPSAVFHTTIGPLAARTRCAVTTGLLVLRPSAAEFGRALALLDGMRYSQEQYDGGDEEFWLRFFSESKDALYELPWRYHAHRLLPLGADEWQHVRMLHLINALAGRGWHIPKVRSNRTHPRIQPQEACASAYGSCSLF